MFPSIFAHTFSGILIAFSLVLMILYYRQLERIDMYQIITLILLFSITIGIHSISHLVLEKNYNYYGLAYL